MTRYNLGYPCWGTLIKFRWAAEFQGLEVSFEKSVKGLLKTCLRLPSHTVIIHSYFPIPLNISLFENDLSKNACSYSAVFQFRPAYTRILLIKYSKNTVLISKYFRSPYSFFHRAIFAPSNIGTEVPRHTIISHFATNIPSDDAAKDTCTHWYASTPQSLLIGFHTTASFGNLLLTSAFLVLLAGHDSPTAHGVFVLLNWKGCRFHFPASFPVVFTPDMYMHMHMHIYVRSEYFFFISNDLQ